MASNEVRSVLERNVLHYVRSEYSDHAYVSRGEVMTEFADRGHEPPDTEQAIESLIDDAAVVDVDPNLLVPGERPTGDNRHSQYSETR